jgi:hypothetical protein
MPQMKAIKNHIIFQFLDGFSKRDVKQFAESTDWGFEVVRHEDSVQKARWGIVVSKGKDVPDDIKVGMEIYIDALRWTEAFTFEDQQYWRTDATEVLLVNEDTENSAGQTYTTPDNSKIKSVW